jgi:hypothetical protein
MTGAGVALGLTAIILIGCALCATIPGLFYDPHYVTFTTNDSTVTLYVQEARTDVQQERGLMFVQNLPYNDGMIFIFPAQEVQSFWMKDTLIPLDNVFIDDNLTITAINANATPMDTTPYDAMARYVIEVNGDYCEQNNIIVGDHVRLNL